MGRVGVSMTVMGLSGCVHDSVMGWGGCVHDNVRLLSVRCVQAEQRLCVAYIQCVLQRHTR